MRRRRGGISPFIWLALAAVAALWAIPLLWTILVAFRPPDQAVSVGSVIPTSWTLKNFARAWDYAPFAPYYLNTPIIVVGILALQLVTATLAAYAFARMEFRGRDLLFLLFLLQSMVPAEALVVPNHMSMRYLGYWIPGSPSCCPILRPPSGRF